MERKSVPDQFGRLYIDDVQNGCLMGTWVRRAEVDALLDYIDRLQAENDRLNMEMVAHREKLTPKDVEAMTAVINALQAAKHMPKNCTHRFENFSNGIISCQDCGAPQSNPQGKV